SWTGRGWRPPPASATASSATASTASPPDHLPRLAWVAGGPAPRNAGTGKPGNALPRSPPARVGTPVARLSSTPSVRGDGFPPAPPPRTGQATGPGPPRDF